MVFLVVISQRQLGVRLRQPKIPVPTAVVTESGLGVLPRLRTAGKELTLYNLYDCLLYS